MKRALLAAALVGVFVYCVIMFLTGAQSAVEYDTDINQDGVTDAIDIAIVRSQYNQRVPTPTPYPNQFDCTLSWDGTQSHLTGTGWPTEFDGAEVHWQGDFGEEFTEADVTAGELSASITGHATFAGVVGVDGMPYAAVC